MITFEELKRLVSYDPETGLFTRLVATGYGGCHKPGPMRRHIRRGYARVFVDGRMYFAHRIAWFITHRKMPDRDIDHINGDRSDNRLCNLRLATRAENMQNERKARKTNASGLLGVSKHGSNWRAQITVDGVSIKLGSFGTPEDAHNAYLKAKRKFHPFATI